MHSKKGTVSGLATKSFMETMIHFGIIAFLTILCVRIFSPFVPILLWGLIISIMLYPLHQRLAKFFSGRQGLAATVLVLAGFLLLGVPMVLISNSLVNHIHDVGDALQNNELAIKAPDAKVSEWPIIGKKLYPAWNEASKNLPKFLKNYRGQIKKISKRAVSAAANVMGSLLLFLGAFIIAGIMMAWGKDGERSMLRILCRVAGPIRGPELHALSIDTTRSVAAGVLGVAFIQALLFGIGFILAGIPAAGLLALIVLFMGIIQLPAVIVSVPAIIYVWSSGDASTIGNISFTLFFVLSGLSDNVLKPILLGRGVDAPMPVILIGALGGMVTAGFIGLFLGAILLAIGYKVFMGWVDNGQYPAVEESESPDSTGDLNT